MSLNVCGKAIWSIEGTSSGTDTDTATVRIQVNGVNEPLEANDDPATFPDPAYTTTEDGVMAAVSSLDISADTPAIGGGFYYVVKPLGCGSWQTAPGAEPGRETGLP